MIIKFKPYVLLTLATFFFFIACKPNLGKEAFAGTHLGIKSSSFSKEVHNNKLFAWIGGKPYYSFKTSDFKQFYAGVLSQYNKDSIVVAMSVFVSQVKEEIPNLNNLLLSNTMMLNLSRSYSPSDEEIYIYLKKQYSEKYPVIRDESVPAWPMTYLKEYKTVYNAGDLQITISRVINEHLSQEAYDLGQGVSRIIIKYEFTDDYMKKNKLNVYKKSTDDL